MSSSRTREELSPQEQIGALVDERLLRLLSDVFPRKLHLPGVTLDQVMWDNAQAAVIEFLHSCRNQARDL